MTVVTGTVAVEEGVEEEGRAKDIQEVVERAVVGGEEETVDLDGVAWERVVDMAEVVEGL